MQKRLLAVAVAGALAAPAIAMAQSSVTISGAANLWWDSAEAKGASNAPTAAISSFDVKARDRLRDGAGSNIRFAAVEDIGGGLQAFAQIESAIFNNADTRADAVGNGAATGGWGNRNSGVGLRGTAWGEILMGVWDVHYQESYAVDNQLIKGASHSSSLALLNSFGTAGFATGAGSLGAASIGARYSNVLRYQSPSWGGFNFRAVMARPTDGTVPTAIPSVTDGTKNRAWNIVPTYANGPIYVSWSYLQDKDIVTTQATTYTGAAAVFVNGVAGAATVGSAGATNLSTITSNRIHGAYTFPFGLKLGLIWDSSKIVVKSTPGAAAGSTFGDSEAKKTVWSIPISWTTGPHTIFGTYAMASKLKGSIGQANANSVDLGAIRVAPGVTPGATPLTATTAPSVGDNTAAKFYAVGYQFDLSKRTNLHVSFAQIKNDSLGGYDFFSNTVGMANGNYGADPRIFALGLRHAF